MSVFFLGSWEMNRSAEQTNRVNREKKIAHWAQFVPVLEWLKTGNELGVYINIHVEC